MLYDLQKGEEKKNTHKDWEKKNLGPFVKYILAAFFHSSVEGDAGTRSIFWEDASPLHTRSNQFR